MMIRTESIMDKQSIGYSCILGGGGGGLADSSAPLH